MKLKEIIELLETSENQDRDVFEIRVGFLEDRIFIDFDDEMEYECIIAK